VRFLLLILTTIRRLTILIFVFLAWAPAAYAWSRPVEGPVLQPFVYDEAHPYAAGQHRGIDIGADAAGEVVVAPSAGTISFAGSVAANGKSVTIETADGYSVTLTHLGSYVVSKGETVAERDEIGTVGPSGTPEVDGPYVHLGIRVTEDPNGYVDPLSLLPPAAETGGTQTGSTTSQPIATAAPSATPASKPAPSAAKSSRPASGGRARPESARSHVRTRQQASTQKPGSHARTSRSQLRPAARDRASERMGSSRRRVVAPRVPRRIGLDVGHDIRPSASIMQPLRKPSSPWPGFTCNGAVTVFAFALVLAANRRRCRTDANPAVRAQVLHLPRPADARVSRAA
jgi:hypothetical protein